MVHGNIRCHKIFVVASNANQFQVKLGEPGILTLDRPDNVHWLPVDLLLKNEPLTRLDLSSWSDVWAYGTTLWQILSFGIHPSEVSNLDSQEFRQCYVEGFVLPKPNQMNHSCVSQIYDCVLHNCWQPDPDQRMPPQEIMKRMNQILYRVFNSKKAPPQYIYIDERTRTSSCASVLMVSSDLDSTYQKKEEKVQAPRTIVQSSSLLPPEGEARDGQDERPAKSGDKSCQSALRPVCSQDPSIESEIFQVSCYRRDRVVWKIQPE